MEIPLKNRTIETIDQKFMNSPSPIQLYHPEHWKEYELIDCGNFEKLERFGNITTIRPEPQAIWDKSFPESEWKKQAHAKFIGISSSSGKWEMTQNCPENWEMNYHHEKLNLNFNLSLTKFKHVGIFPEQAVNWDYISNGIHQLKKEGIQTPKFLNLFAYTGGASIAAKQAGADVTHVDAVRQIISWSKRNMESSNLRDIRWVVEDAVTFVKRELKRGNTYNGIILDPPAFGRGPNGESWKLEDDINELLKNVLRLLSPNHSFFILNTYSLGFSSLIPDNILKQELSALKIKPKEYEIGELFLKDSFEKNLPLGVLVRFKL